MEPSPSDISPISIFEEIFPGDTNAYGTAFGGKILALMDRAAGLAAARFGKSNFVTASLDALDFRAPVLQGDIAEVEAKVVYTSTHTAGVKVNVYAVEKTEWKRRLCCQGTLFMVAIGPDRKPKEVPMLKPQTDEDRQAWEEARSIHVQMLKRKKKVG